MRLWGGSLRGERTVGIGELLPLHALPTAERDSRLRERAPQAGIVSRPLRRGEPARVEAGGRVGEVVLWRLRVGALQPRPRRSRADEHPLGRLRRRSGNQAERTLIRRLRRPLGDDPGRRAAALPRERARLDFQSTPDLTRLTQGIAAHVDPGRLPLLASVGLLTHDPHADLALDESCMSIHVALGLLVGRSPPCSRVLDRYTLDASPKSPLTSSTVDPRAILLV